MVESQGYYLAAGIRGEGLQQAGPIDGIADRHPELIFDLEQLFSAVLLTGRAQKKRQELNSRHNALAQNFIEHIQQIATPFWLQRIHPEDQPAMFRHPLIQLLQDGLPHGPQQSQKLTIQLAHIALVDFDPALVQCPLDLYQLAVMVFRTCQFGRN